VTKNALVTGATGQDGRYLIEILRRHGYAVHAQTRGPSPLFDNPGVRWYSVNLKDSESLEKLIVDILPDEIYNLAAISRPTHSWTEPRETAEINAFLPQRICELLLKHRPSCRLFQASSSEMFGDGFSELQDEQSHCNPKTPYGVAKLYAHRIVGAYRQQYGLFASCGIMFNHESIYRPLTYVSQKIAYGAAAASLGLKESPDLDERGRPIFCRGRLLLGDLSVRRDFGFAGDYAEAMYLLLQRPTPDDFVIGTGENHSIQDFCQVAFAEVGLDWTDYVNVDPKLIRRTDSHYTRALPAKLRAACGWHAKTSFAELVSTMAHHQLERLRGGCVSRPLRIADAATAVRGKLNRSSYVFPTQVAGSS
jgi:GDPmannose 4,6-dehydratase